MEIKDQIISFARTQSTSCIGETMGPNNCQKLLLFGEGRSGPDRKACQSFIKFL